MFTETIAAIRSGATTSARRAALRKDLKVKNDQELDEKLAEIEAQAQDELDTAQREESERLKREEQSARLLAAENALADHAVKMDELLAKIGATFDAMDEAFAEMRDAGGDVKDVTFRRFTLINACWFHARNLSARLGVARSAGGPSKWKPLAEVFTKKDPLDA